MKLSSEDHILAFHSLSNGTGVKMRTCFLLDLCKPESLTPLLFVPGFVHICCIFCT